MIGQRNNPNISQVFQIGIDLGESVLSKIDKVSGKEGEELAYKGAMLFFFCKAYKSYQAAQLLWESGFEEDAFMLTRTIFELALQARYMSEDPKPLARLYAENDIVVRYRYYLRVKALNNSAWNATFKAREHELQGLEEEYNRLKGKYPERRGWWGESIAWLARHLGKDMETRYVAIYWMPSNLVHSGPPSVKEYVTESQGGLKVSCRPSRSDHPLVPQEATLYFFDVIRHAVPALELGLDDQIAQALESFQSVLGLAPTTTDTATGQMPR